MANVLIKCFRGSATAPLHGPTARRHLAPGTSKNSQQIRCAGTWHMAPRTWCQQEFATNPVCWTSNVAVMAPHQQEFGTNRAAGLQMRGILARGRGFGGGLFLLAARLALAATLALAAVATVHRPPLTLLRRRALALAAVAPVHRPPLLLLRRTVAPVLRPPLLLLRRRTRALAGLLGKLLLPPSTSTISTSTSAGIRTSTS